MGHHGAVAVAVRELYGIEGLGQGTNLVDLYEQRVGRLLINALLQASRVGDKEVIADDLDLIANSGGQGGVAFPVVFLQWVLDGHDGVLVDELLVDLGHLLGGVLAAFEVVLAVLVELGGSDVEGQGNVLAWLEAGLLDGLNDDVERSAGGIDGRSKAALIAQTGGQALVLQDGLQGVVYASTDAESLGEGLCADGGNHELLHVHAGVSVGTAVQDVHHGNGKNVSVWAADVAVERQRGGLGRGLSGSDGNTEDGIGAEAGLIIRAVQLDERLVNEALVISFEASDFIADFLVDVFYGLLHALAQVAVAAVAQLVCLVHTGGCAGGNAGSAVGAVLQEDLGLYGRVTAGIQDLASKCVDDTSHAVTHSL